MWEWVGERQAEDYRRELWGAWHMAAYMRMKRLPDLANTMRRFERRGRVEPQTPDQMLDAVRLLNEAFGGRDLTRKGTGRG